ncbi:anthranilate phosphoribosyltransferase [Rheinheimera riviphila]|uniref:Anthranilate phosphoribosyltransferase n=1 Tax=Rheinheimera riviphila TaxID=1834037 RepID=A0A437QG53_9GAMM|nr:anthranilate phosphoribosyltransferase [Rheinheimera riviphila]RVU33525.1 anthranilate phosphoribosyltransferase [Rheinheimera riviphila]
MFRHLLQQLSVKAELTAAEISLLLSAIANDELNDTQLAAVLMGLLLKGVTPAETTAIVQAMRHYSVPIQPKVPEDLLDTCGTGGGLSTFNISTASAFVCAAAGIPVAKHGSRSISSLCGSADVLQALGVVLKQAPRAIEQMIEQIGIGFIHAPDFNPVMRRVLPVEASLGIKTIFYTLVGPLINPAQARRHLLGVFRQDLVEPTAYVADKLEFSRAMIVHGLDGVDELSLLGPTQILELENGQLTRYQICPEDFGLQRCKLADIGSQVPLESAELLRAIFAGKLHGPARDAVLLNSAGALMMGHRAANFAEGIQLAAQLIDEGKVTRKLRELVMMSHDLAAQPATPAVKNVVATGVESPTVAPLAAADPALVPPSAERIWQGILESAPDGILVLNQQGLVLVSNTAAGRLFELSPAHMFGHPYCTLLPADLQLQHRQQLAAVQQQAHIAQWEERMHDLQLAQRLIPINDGDNILLISRDITAQRRLEASEQNKRARLHTLIETLPDLIWLQDKAGRYLNCNHRFERFFGTPEALIKGRRDVDFLPAELAAALFQSFELALREKRAVLSWQWITFAGDGHQEYVEIIQTPFFDHHGVLNGVMGIARDVTAFKTTTDELTRHRDQLELIVAERTKGLSQAVTQLRQMQNQLIEAEKLSALGTVVAGISHEMNTPVGNILTATTALQGDVATIAGQLAGGILSRTTLAAHLQNSAQMLDLAVRSAQQTVQLINNFKQVATAQIAEQRRHFSLNELVEQKVQAMLPIFETLSLTVQNQLLAPIGCDSFPAAVGQIVGQLLQNCAQHAFVKRSNGQVVVQALVEEKQLQLSISDNGCGMTTAQQIRVFDPFFSANMSNGTGLGLPICKRLASGVLGGELTVSSQAGVGSTFTLTMPLVAPGYRTHS